MANNKSIIEGEEINLIALVSYSLDLAKKYILLLIALPIIGVGIVFFLPKANSTTVYQGVLTARTQLLTPNEVENIVKNLNLDFKNEGIEAIGLAKIRELSINGFYTTEFTLNVNFSKTDFADKITDAITKKIQTLPFVIQKFAEKKEREQGILNSIEAEIAKNGLSSNSSNSKDCVLNMLTTKADFQSRLKSKADIEIVTPITKNILTSEITTPSNKKIVIIGFIGGLFLAIASIILIEVSKKIKEFRNS